MAQKLEIYSKTPGGFILHIVNILLVLALSYVVTRYLPVSPPSPYYMNFDKSEHGNYDAFYALKKTMEEEYEHYYATYAVSI